MPQFAVLLGWVAVGSAVGGAARVFVSGFVARVLGKSLPWGTLVVNVTGSAAIGVLAALAEAEVLLVRPEASALVVTGFLGSYTTVSAFSLQTLALAQAGDVRKAAGNVVLSLGLCLAAAAAGLLLARAALNGAAA